MKERPILFSTPMVQAILANRKTQTRRICKPLIGATGVADVYHRPDGLFIGTHLKVGDGVGVTLPFICPYGQAGDKLWVRETWQGYRNTSYEYDEWEPMESPKDRHHQNYDPVYKADNESFPDKWFPAIHMPREFSRIQLEITDVRVEPLQKISGPDCAAEGIQFRGLNDGPTLERGVGIWKETKTHYRKLWESINGKGSWDANPWVWVVSFKKL